MASDDEMRASAEFGSAGVCVRFLWSWCNLPFVTFLHIRLQKAAPGFCMSAPAHFFVTPVAAEAYGWGAMSHVPISKAWRQTHLDAFVLAFDAALSTRGVAGLYGFRRGATRFLLAYTGDVEMAIRTGLWMANSTLFLFHELKFMCRGTIRARVMNCFPVDRQDLMDRMEGLVENFME